MKKETRTKNVIKNTGVTLICHIMFLICSFICRTIFTKQLGAEYLGISGLFSNILTILSFAELGLGSTLVYRLYRPFAENDYNKINLYVKLYKKIYNVIIIIILVLGLSIIPFLKYLVEAPNVKESLVLLYLLYLFQTVSSYLFVYKKTLLTANQKDYIVSLFTEIINVVMNIFQCVALIFFKDFVIYIVLSIIFTIINNIACSIYVDRRYKFLKQSTKGKLTKGEIVELKKDTKGLMMTKIASTVFSGTDNIFISSFIGIKYVGILSNYTLLLSTVNALMNKVFNSITSSIGNLTVSKNGRNKTEGVLFKLFFLNSAMYSYICICLFLLIGEFVTNIWLGSDFFLPQSVIIIAIVELYFRSIHYPVYITRNAYGLFSQYRFLFVVSAVLNIALDFLLVKPLGIFGLFLATILCRGITYVVDIFVLYKYGFQKSPINYYKRLFKWIIFVFVSYFISYFTIVNIKDISILNFILKGIIVTFIYFISFLLFFFHSREMKYYIDLFKKGFSKITQRRKKYEKV